MTITVQPAPPPPPVNVAPAVNAGSDQTVTLPNGVQMRGSVTDDGRPVGPPLIAEWSVDSGGTATFANASYALTTVTFAQAGTYVLRLTGSDGALSAFDTVTIAVLPALPVNNLAPLVHAGADQNITLPSTAQLLGSVTDDGLPAGSPLTALWSVDSGGSVGFINASTGFTIGTFTQSGTYVLRLTGSDGALTAFDTVTVTVAPVPPPVNQAPVVNAGADQVITLPNPASIVGTATDDGYPAGSTLLRQWTQDSGPATAVFANAAGASTSAMFTVSGTYVLRLAASDGSLSAFDTVTVQVNPVPPPTNQPPAVGAGADQTIAFPVNQVSLAGTRSDDGLPAGSTIGVQWTRDSGTGSVTFGTATNAATTAAFDQPGTYVLRLTATDGALSAFDTVTIVVNPPANQAPVVGAGPDQSVTLPVNVVALSGGATDDGLPAGAAIAFRWSVVSGPTVPSIGEAASRETAATFSQAGTYVLRLTATDGDRSAFDDLSVIVSPGAPPPPVNRNPVAQAGGPYSGDATSPLGLSAAASTDPDGDALGYQWTFGDGQSGTGRTPTHAWAAQGTFAVSVTVTDGRGGSATAATQAAIGPPVDRAPPSVRLRAPARVLPGEQFTATAEAEDNVAVTGVVFEVNASMPTDTTIAPYQRLITAPPLAAPGTTIALRATARDARGNSSVAQASVLVTAVPDTQAPSLSLLAPPETAPGSQVLITAQAADNVGVDAVSFAIAGQSLGIDRQPAYEARYTVLAGTPVGTTLTFTARATDAAGNTTDRAASVQVVAAPDTTPPTVALVAPAETSPGSTLTLTAVVADNVGVAGVQFFADDVPLSTDAEPPYVVDLPVASNRPNGSVVRTRAIATDFTGLTASSAADTVVRAQTIGAGMVFGEVYDDATGLPVPDVRVRLDGAGAAGGPYTETATTDTRGRYVIQGREGVARVTLSKVGWTTVVRIVTVAGNRAVEAIDARLTTLGGPLDVAAVLGRTFQSTDVHLDLPSGALSADATMHLTPVSAQGLAALLPIGWSPVAALDVLPNGLDLALPAVVSMRTVVTLPVATPIAVLAWDNAAGGWRVIATTTTGAAGAMLDATLARTAAVVWAVADMLPLAPPAAVAGDLLAGLDVAGPLGATDVVQVTPQPNVVVYQPGVRSQVGGRLTTDQPVSSGRLLRANLLERYDFFSGTTTAPDPFRQDLVFYQIPGTVTALSASFVVSPSVVFEPAFLRQGVITVEIVERGAAPDAAIIDATGGISTSAVGEAITVPPGALASGVPAVVSHVADADLGIVLVPPLQFIAAANVSLSGALLAAPASLSVPRPSGVFNDEGVILLRITEIDGGSRLALVALGRIAGDHIVSDVAVPGIAAPLDGIRQGGRYVFARISAPFGFVTGLVRGTSGAPFAGALIASSTVPSVALSQSAGQYVTVGLSGPVAVQALDIARRDTGAATGVLTPGGILRADLSIVLDPPRVTSVTPAGAAGNVSLGSPVVVSFSEPIDPASIGAFRVETGGALVPGSVTLSDTNRLATFRATGGLVSATTYTVRVTTGLTDLSGRTLAAEFSAAFTSLDTAPPPPPPAGAITATIPGFDGLSTVSGTQGSAGLRDTVDVVNVTRQSSSRALVNPNGSFSTVIATALGDRLQVIITREGGAQTVVPTPPFARTNADGSRSVVTGAAGGRLDGPSGIVVDVPAGAFPDGTLVTMRYVDEARFPIPLTAEQRELFAFTGGVALDFGGAVPSHYLNVSLPAAPGDKQTDRWVVGAVQEVNGRLLLNAVDTARVIDGRVMTASPPCPGVQAAATYGYIKSTKQPVGVSYGQTSGGNGSLSYGMEIVNPYSPTPLVMPWNGYSDGAASQSVCFPILMGRTTVTPNAQRLVIQADQFAPTSRELLVHNVSSNARLRFPRNVIEYRFSIGGTTDDTYTTSVVTPSGEQIVPNEISPAASDFVIVRLDMDTIFANVSEVVIRNISRNPVEETHIPQSQAEVEVPVSGGATDTYVVTVLDSEGTEFPVEWTLRSPNGAGNLVARVLPVTLDPDTTVSLVNASQGTQTTVPPEFIQYGGMIYPFTAQITDRFGLRVIYRDGRPDEVTGIPAVRIVVRSGETGRVVRTIEVPVPPLDEPFFNLGAIDGDTTPPRLVRSPGLLRNFDPSAPLSFTFSEGIDRTSALLGVHLTTEDGVGIDGEVRLSQGNTVVTFVPFSPLELGTTFRLSLDGLFDAAGNRFRPFEITLTTFAPMKVGAGLSAGTINGTVRDIAFLNVPQTGGQVRHFAYEIIDDGNVAFLVTLDMTNPDAPVQLSSRLGGNSAVTVVTGVQNMLLRAPSECGGASTFSGNLAITTNYTNVGSSVQFWDLTNPVEPCMMGSKLLTVSPSFAAGNRGSITGNGRARRVAAVKTDAGVIAYVAVEEVGLMMVDVGGNSPRVLPSNGVREPFAAGNYSDVLDTGSVLLATERSQSRLDIFDTSLTLLHEIPLERPGAEPLSLAFARGWGIDDDENGVFDPQELYDFVFVGTSIGVVVVDITHLDSPWVRGVVPSPGSVFRLAVDVERRRIYTGGARVLYGNDWAVSMFDMGAVNPFVERDDNEDGLDDRVIWQSPAGYLYQRHGYRALALDAERGALFVGLESPTGAPGGLDIWSIINVCCDLGVDTVAEPGDAPAGDREVVLVREKKALEKGLAAGLAAAQACGVPIRTGLPITANSISIIEQGSGACLWRENPVADCGPAYQPGLSDHDFEVFIPGQFLPGTATSGGKCVVKALHDQFTDENKQPKAIDVGGVTMRFKDITFFPVEKERFENAKLDVEPPRQEGNDPTGDLGLGRQQLLLKWVLEGEYITPPGWHVAGRALEEIMSELRDGPGIARLEGFEWGMLQRFNLVKSNAFLRIKGSSGASSAFHDLFVSQLHDAGKTGIRAALARMVADEQANEMVLNVTRGAYASDACLSISPSVPPAAWSSRPCGSFEEYVASAAGWTVRRGWDLFTAEQVAQQVYRFFEVKADEGERITTEPDADQFIAMASRFIDSVLLVTHPIYDQTAGADPDSIRRGENMLAAVTKTVQALAAGKLQVVPRVFHTGFVGASDVALTMYRGRTVDPEGTPLKTVRLSLAANEVRFLRNGQDLLLPETADGLSEADRNLNDLASGTSSTRTPLFMLGAGSAENPYINFGSEFGLPRYVAFTIDLPERKIEEGYRRNNYNGFFYYVLDRVTAVSDRAGAIPLPIANPDPYLLDPDAQCLANLEVQVTQKVLRPGGNPDNAVSDWVLARGGETLTFRVTVRNNSAQDVPNAKVCNSIMSSGSECRDIGALGASQEAFEDFTITVPANANGEYRDAVPSVEAPQIGFIEGPTLRVIVACDDVAVVPAPGDPIPPADSEDAKVMRGGQGLRSFRVVTRNGQSLVGHNIEIEVTTPGRGRFTTNYHTDSDGRLTLGDNDPYVVVNVDQSLAPGTKITARIVSIDGHLSYCLANTDLFTMVVSDRTWSKQWQAGSAINSKYTVEFGVSSSKGAGFSFKIDEIAGKGREKLTFGRSNTTQAGIVETVGETEVKGFIFGAGFQAGAKLEAGINFGQSRSDEHEFTFGPGQTALAHQQSAVVGGLLMSIAALDDPMLRKLADKLNGLADAGPYRVTETFSMGLDAYVNASASAFAGWMARGASPSPLTQKTPVKFGIEAGASASAALGVAIAINDAFVKKELTPSVELKGAANIDVSLSLGNGELAKDPVKATKKLTLLDKIKAGLKGSYAGGVKLGVTLDKAKDNTVKKLTLTLTEQKSWGWSADYTAEGTKEKKNLGKGGSGGETPKTSFEISITDPATIKKVAALLESYGAMMGAFVVGTPVPPTAPELGPTLLVDHLSKLFELLMSANATFTKGVEIGEGITLPSVLGAEIAGVGLEWSVPVSADRSISYTEATGVVRNGHIYDLSRYPRSLFPVFGDAVDEFEEMAGVTINAAIALVGNAVDMVVGALIDGPNSIRSNHTAQLDFSGVGEAPFAPAIASWVWEPATNPTGFRIQRPADYKGPVDVGHYGVGGFHQFLPKNRTLLHPATLTFFYNDAELNGIDENTLAIYRWNPARVDWDYVGGTRNPGANTVTTTVAQLALYTMAPPLPAGDITLTASWLPSGSDQNPVTTATYTSGALRMNTGAVVPDGTLYTVVGAESTDRFVPFGTVLTPDADPTTPGTQVASAGGTLQFTVVYQGASGDVRPMVFSRAGTALAVATMPLRP